jgi:hypothetical protein
MSVPMPADGGGVPKERVDGDGALPGERVDGGAVPGLKAVANPTRSTAVEGKGCDRRAPSTPHGMYRVG